MAHDIKNYDPLKDVRSDLEAMGKDSNARSTAPEEPNRRRSRCRKRRSSLHSL